MRNLGAIFPLIIAVLMAGVMISIIGGSYAHWIWIIIALGVVAEIAAGSGR